MSFKLVCALLALALPMTALAGDDPVQCNQADLTLDGRYALLRPGCIVSNAVDLQTGKLVGTKAAERIAKGAGIMPLRPASGKGRFDKWLNREWTHDESMYTWDAFDIPGTGWILRYKTRARYASRAAVHGKGVQYAPRAAFEAMHKTKKRKLPAIDQPLPKVGPFGTIDAPELLGVLTAGASKKRGQTTRKAFTYDAAAFGRAVPTYGDFLRHATMRWKEVRSESGSTGWVIVNARPKGFWAGLAPSATRYRIVDYKKHWASFELERIYRALKAGKEVSFRTFKPYRWTIYTLTPAVGGTP